jgi:lipopolysaccharide biosynthesis glycosyltransferase
MIDLLRRNHFYFRRHQSFDQSMLNLLFRDEWEPLGEEMNWRPFQGINSRAAILHFHGPKPHRIQAILDGQASADEAQVMSRLVFDHRLKYDHYLGEYRGFLAAA